MKKNLARFGLRSNTSDHRIIVDKTVRRILPRSFFSRSLLIILLPLIVIQGVSLELFYGTFLNTVSRRLTDSVGGDICYVVSQLNMVHSNQAFVNITDNSQQYLQLNLQWKSNELLSEEKKTTYNMFGPVDELLDRSLQDKLSVPFITDWKTYSDKIKVSLQLSGGVLEIFVPKKRLFAGSVWLFVVWIVGSAVILFIIAAVFTWIQSRAIRHLSKAVDAFGKGRDKGRIRAVGSREIRNAAMAFNLMRERILRFMKQRTVILASVSHDLRTPLTRLRLGLAMLPQKGVFNAEDQATDIAEMIGDIDEMEQMISGYLSFARGEGAEDPKITDMVQLIEDSVAAAYRSGTEFISTYIPASLPDMNVRAGSIRRVLGNILENAKKHGGRVELTAEIKGKGLFIVIDDDGPGIPQDRQESVFTPFETGNTQKGTGLGLAIVKNIIQGHGGDVKLKNSPLGGLRVIIYLPI